MEATNFTALISIIMGSGIALLYATVSKQVRPLLLMINVYFVFFLLIPGSHHALLNEFPFFRKSYDGSVVSVFLIFFHFGYFATKVTAKKPEQTGAPKTSFAIFLIFLAIAAVMLTIQKVGLDLMFSTRLDFETSADISGFESILFLAFARMCTFITVTYCFFLWRLAANRGLALFLLIVSASLFLTANYPLALPRYYLMGFLLSWFVMAGGILSVRRRIGFVLSVLLVVVLVLPILSAATKGIDDGYDLTRYLETEDFDGLQSINNAVMFVRDQGPQMGRQALSTALFFVPRFFWPDKAESTGVTIARFANYEFFDISAPLPAEIYIDFHYPGLIFFAFILGWICRRLDAWVNAQFKANFVAKLWTGILVGFSIIVLRGSLLSIAAPVAYVVALTYLASWLGVLKSKGNLAIAEPGKIQSAVI